MEAIIDSLRASLMQQGDLERKNGAEATPRGQRETVCTDSDS